MRFKEFSSSEIKSLVIHSAIEANILPVTSKCDAKCVFCSHHNNPAGICALSIGTYPMDSILETIPYLDPNQVITMGESASNIIEGEPLIHPQFKEIITEVRKRFPFTPISVTTNGHHLDPDMIDFLNKNDPIMLNVSLNSASVKGRAILMQDSEEQARRTIAGIELLNNKNILYFASLVAMPNLVGWDDIRNTVEFLDKNNARIVRLFVPGFSNNVNAGRFPDPEKIEGQLKDFMNEISPSVKCPILLEPSIVSDLTPEISGVIYESPPWHAGLRRGDVVLSVNGQTPRCRDEAWEFMQRKGQISAVVRKNGLIKNIEWKNPGEGDPGVITEHDFDINRAEHIKALIHSAGCRVLALCSEAGMRVLHEILYGLLNIPPSRAEIHAVKNRTFGGSIKAAGLLTISDYIAAYEEFNKLHNRPGAILLPSESFNSLGYDLTGFHYEELRRHTGVPVLLE